MFVSVGDLVQYVRPHPDDAELVFEVAVLWAALVVGSNLKSLRSQDHEKQSSSH